MNVTLKPRTDRQGLVVKFVGRFGNRLFEFASAKARAEREGLELRCLMWEGKFLFEDCNDPEPTFDGTEIVHNGEHDGYCQHQDDIDKYSRADCLRWFAFHKDVAHALADSNMYGYAVAHNRVGDYANLGYVVVKRESIMRLCPNNKIHVLSEEEPTQCRTMPDFVSFAPDFFKLMTARVVIRANSSFSWWAATLNTHADIILSPIVTGLKGGQEHDCEFVIGNHPRFCDLPNHSDLHLKP